MASITHEGNGRRRVQFIARDGKRRGFQLGKVTAGDAKLVRRFVEDLVSCRVIGGSPKPATADWIAELPDSLRGKLERLDLVAARERRECPTVAGWIGEYIAGRSDVKPNTLRNLKQTERSVIGFFGKAKRLDEITPGDAEDYRIHLKDQRLAEGTIRRRCKRARQFFTAAVKKKIISENPFADMKCGNYSDAERFYFVSVDEAAAVLDACPDAEWRLLFALCRYGGLRCPSEVLRLRWGDVDWEGNRFTVHASKTEHNEGGGIRHVPIFPELRPYLADCFHQAEPGTENVITGYGHSDANLRTQLTRIIKRAGLSPWPKLFQNLRSTRETELVERFPLHAVCQWLGNSTGIAAKHYLQVTDDHFRRATGTPGDLDGIRAESVHMDLGLWDWAKRPSTARPEKPGFRADSTTFHTVPCTDTPSGGRTLAKNREFSAIPEDGPCISRASGPGDGELRHVISAWPDLPDATKGAILAVVDSAAAVPGA